IPRVPPPVPGPSPPLTLSAWSADTATFWLRLRKSLIGTFLDDFLLGAAIATPPLQAHHRRGGCGPVYAISRIAPPPPPGRVGGWAGLRREPIPRPRWESML